MSATMETPAVYRMFFKAALAQVRKRVADYDQEVREWYEDGDGRSPQWVVSDCEGHESTNGPIGSVEFCDGSCERPYNFGGLGHRFPHCIHGSDLTTDYDNICGGCEDSLTIYEEARAVAHHNWQRFVKAWDWVAVAPTFLPQDLRDQMLTWAIATFPKGE